MTTKFTPGPWNVCKDGSLGSVESSATGQMVAQAQQLTAPAGLDKERIANTLLIASAPELLEALNDCIDDWTDGYRITEVKATLAKARAAIAKATGEPT